MNDPSNSRTQATRVAIECLTLWMESGDQASQNAMDHILRIRTDQDVSEITIIAGLLNLTALAIKTLAQERGATPPQVRDHMGDILQDWSLKMPDS